MTMNPLPMTAADFPAGAARTVHGDQRPAGRGRAGEPEQRSRQELLGLLAGRDRLIEQLRARVAELEARLEGMERLLSRNSGNSSMPPSSDDLPGKKPPQDKPRRSGDRRPGKQPGAPGAYLAWNDHPDKTIPHFPRGTCACGRNLAGARDLGVRYSYQMTDLPEARAETTQHDRHEAQCACGRCTSRTPRRSQARREQSPTG
jgi:transposase